MVGALDLETHLVQGHAHGVTQVRLLVHGGHGEVAALEGGLVGQVATLLLAAAVPRGLLGVQLVEGGLRADLEAGVVEHEELGLGREVGGVRDARGGQVGLGALGHTAGVAVVGLTGAGVHDRARDHQGLLHAEGIHEGRLGVGDQLHVGLGDALEAADRGPVEELAVREEILVHRLGRQVEVLLHPGHVREAEVDEHDLLVLEECQNFFG